MFSKEIVKALCETLVEGGIYIALFVLPCALLVLSSIHSACGAI